MESFVEAVRKISKAGSELIPCVTMNPPNKTTIIATEIILKLGAEGGQLILYGIRTVTGWRFSLETYDCAVLFLDEDDVADLPPETPGIDSGKIRTRGLAIRGQAIALLDDRPWECLSPEFIHPEFRAQVWKVIESRLGRGGHPRGHMPPDFRKRALNRWRRVCDGIES